jgi:exodeoxyribonuclease VII large subunit
MNFLTLRELANLIRNAISITLPDEYWVIAEIAQINCHASSGHCYLDLVEKQDNSVAAKMRANIWAANYRQISSNFERLTGQSLQPGMKILILARINYHEVHGLSLNIREIDPNYTLGEMALRRRQVIEQLTKEGIVDLNRKIPLPPVLQRIAVISSSGAAGYGDFLSRIDNNAYGYTFSHRLFHAYVQGEKAEESIRSALRSCLRLRTRFDVVVIIRGGGSAVDLNCFDSYGLSREIALSPLPVLTGIGHERDETVADRVAHMRLITPTAVADFLISRSRDFEDGIDDLRQRLVHRTNTLITSERHLLENLSSGLSRFSIDLLKLSFQSLKQKIFTLQASSISALKMPFTYLDVCRGNVKYAADRFLASGNNAMKEYARTLLILPGHLIAMSRKEVENAEAKVLLLDPVNVLKRGYSITFFEGRPVKDINMVKKPDIISTRLSNGTITSIVEDIQPEADCE